MLEQLLLPGVNLVRMNLIALGQIGYRRLLPQRFQRDLGLQYRINLPSRSLRVRFIYYYDGTARPN